MREFFRRRLDYTTRMHMKRRASRIDLRFLLAAAALGATVFLAMRYL
jgi:hypothetical protein